MFSMSLIVVAVTYRTEADHSALQTQRANLNTASFNANVVGRGLQQTRHSSFTDANVCIRHSAAFEIFFHMEQT